MSTNCETCANYEYDEYFECWVCAVNLDEDDMQKRLAILARNAQAKRGDIKRRSNQYVAEVINDFIIRRGQCWKIVGYMEI